MPVPIEVFSTLTRTLSPNARKSFIERGQRASNARNLALSRRKQAMLLYKSCTKPDRKQALLAVNLALSWQTATSACKSYIERTESKTMYRQPQHRTQC